MVTVSNTMGSTCTQKEILAKDPWLKILEEMIINADIKINGSRPWDIKVKNPDFGRRVLQEGSLGLGESYMDGWWECDELDTFFFHILKNRIQEKLPFNIFTFLRLFMLQLINLQTKARAWIVGRHHYDLGNDLFTRMLDPHLQYSCGYWKDAQTLEEAQEHKLQLICEKLQLAPGMRVLDIGCGWGGLAAYAARNYGVSVTGITISDEQHKLALQYCEGLDVKIQLLDYRDLNDQFDRIVSVGMFEHVGPKNYRTFFDVVHRNLTADGIFLLHTIGSNVTSDTLDEWTMKYIFPNGCVPSAQHITAASEPFFVLEDWHNFGPDYDLTLKAWYQRFCATWPEISLNYTDRFKRMFTYYLNSCAGAFRARDLQLWQIVFTRGKLGGLRVPH